MKKYILSICTLAAICIGCVTVTWTPGIQADAIVCTPSAANSSAKTVTYTLTATDISSGSATVTGLEPETSYRATLKLGEKTRGYSTFTTNLDLRDAIQLTPTDDWVTAIQDAAAGSKFALAAGEYTLTSAKLQINNNVTIAAQNSGNLPVINTCIHINNGSSLYLYQVVMDGTGTDGSQAIEYKTAGGFGDLIISSSTFYSCSAKRDILRADDASSKVSASMITSIDKCTFYNVGNGNANYRFFYLRFPGNTNTFTNNVVANFDNTRGFANSTSVGVPSYSNNYYYNCKNLTSQAEGNTQPNLTCFDTEGNILDKNPFADPDNADFTITDELFQSYGFGDPRWY